MPARIYAAAAALMALGLAPSAHASTATVDLSPYANQTFTNSWFIDGGQFAADLPGTTTGNQGSSIPFLVSGAQGGNNFWFGLDDGTGSNNLSGPTGSVTIPVTVSGVNTVYTLADNVFGNYFVDEFDVTFHGAGGDLTESYIGGVDTRDYNTPNCGTTGCTPFITAAPWYNDGSGIVLDMVTWRLPKNFGLTSMTFTQVDGVDGMILAGVSLGVPEPASWALMIGGFGLAGAALRRRRAIAA
ncbi:MAG: PEPxxWA-CTERM sorting domain-containing protein [Phenylobacterium sp.]